MLTVGEAGNLPSDFEIQKMVCYLKDRFGGQRKLDFFVFISVPVDRQHFLSFMLYNVIISKTTRTVVNIKVPVKEYTRTESTSPTESQVPDK